MVYKLNGGVGMGYVDAVKPQPGCNFFATASFAANGTQKAIDAVWSPGYDAITTPADGDSLVYRVFCTGSETILDVGASKTNTRAKFDLYINGVLDTQGIDLYSSSSTSTMVSITLQHPMLAGWNDVVVKTNGRNAGNTTNWSIVLTGIRFR